MTRERRAPSWPGWCCSYCSAPLANGEAGLVCSAEGRVFATHAGVHRLLPEDRLLEARALAARRRPTRDEELLQAESGLPRVLPALRESLGEGPWSALEAGAGACRLSLRLLALGHRVVAVDVELDGPRGLGAAARPLERAEAEAEALPLEPLAFDLVVATGILQHAERPARTLVELRRVTRRGGLLLVLGTPSFPREESGHGGLGPMLPREGLTALFESAGWSLGGTSERSADPWPALVARRDG